MTPEFYARDEQVFRPVNMRESMTYTPDQAGQVRPPARLHGCLRADLSLLYSQPARGYSQFTHLELVDLVWADAIKLPLVERYPGTGERAIRTAHASAYGGLPDGHRTPSRATCSPFTETSRRRSPLRQSKGMAQVTGLPRTVTAYSGMTSAYHGTNHAANWICLASA